ncbi:MAG: ribonuclease Z [Cyclobacteriaceae bacterium]|nr:ribonuclease Z [Cyclobacteriaceae bacterium]
MNSFSLTILGASGAVPVYGRFPSSQYLVIQNKHFLIDCGEGCQLQLARYEIPIHKIDHIFISHLHGDHYLGLTGLLFSMHLQKRKADLHLYSPPGLNEIILLQLKYSRSVLNYSLHFHSFDPTQKYQLLENDALTVETIPLFHKLPCAGFLFKEKPKQRRIDKEQLIKGMLLQHIVALKTGQDVFDEQGKLLYKNEDFTLAPKRSLSYAYCSDTAFFEPIIDQIDEVDLLYHEATFMDEEEAKANETKHSTARQAAEVARRSRAKRLLIGHFSARYKDLEPLLAEAKSVFENSSLAIEGQTFTIEA